MPPMFPPGFQNIFAGFAPPQGQPPQHAQVHIQISPNDLAAAGGHLHPHIHP